MSSARTINKIVQAVLDEFGANQYAYFLKPYINALYQRPDIADRLYNKIKEVVLNG